MPNKHKYCSLFGNESQVDATILKPKLRELFEKLIADGIDRFMFGLLNSFTNICNDVLLELKSVYPHIKTIAFLAKNEQVYTSSKERQEADELMSKLLNKKVQRYNFDFVFKPEELYDKNENIYVMRDKEMINASDICVFYRPLSEHYELPYKSAHSSPSSKDFSTLAFFLARATKKVITVPI